MHNFKESTVKKTKTFRKPKKFESSRTFTLYYLKNKIYKKVTKVRNWLDLAGSHEISPLARETTQKSVSLTANPRDLATMTVYRYIKYLFVKNITESFTSFVLFSIYALKS